MQPGDRLGPYEVVDLLGAGGMGEVYKARDTRLDRTVAIKILPPRLSADSERRARFEREAKTIAGLNHPHICTLFDVGDHEGSTFLVMEHLTGETLAQRLEKGPLPLEQALTVATEIADALSAAHRQGVIHRDLKPGNVMLTKTGAKLLDFGLAKLKGHGEQPAAAHLASAPTQSTPLTGEGMIVGTLQYMAPEQLEAKLADARTDLWALGTILYEMVAGKRAFEGTSAASLIGNIMNADPPALATWQPLTPPAVDRLVRKCLAKAPDDRWESAHDVADELRWIRETSEVTLPAGSAAAAETGRPQMRFAALAVGGLLLVAATAALTWVAVRPAQAPPAAVQRLLVDTRPAEGLRGPNPLERSYAFNRPSRTAIALSPDGTCLVFGAVQGQRQQLYRRRLAEGVAVPLDGTEGAESPFFSPDGTWIGFWARGSLWKMRLDGGAPIELCRAAQVVGASWSSKGTIAFDDAWAASGEILAVPAAGGTPKALSTVDVAHGEQFHVLPHFLPDGESLLFTAVKDWVDLRGSAIAAVSLTSGTRTALVDGAMDARYLPTGHLVYFRRGQLEAVPFDPVRLTVTGEAVGLIPDVMQAMNFGHADVDTGAAQLTTSVTGTLVYVAGGIPGDQRSEIVWVDRRGTIVETLAIPRGSYSAPRLSPDGRRILYVRAGMNGSLWYYDLARRTPTMIPTAEPQPYWAIWLPDGQRAMFAAPPGGFTRLHIVPVDGSTRSETVGGEVPLTATESPGSWTPDGKALIFTRGSQDSPPGLWQLRMNGGRPQRSPLLEPPAPTKGGADVQPKMVTWPALAPDGRWLAYVSNESGRNEVYVQRFPDLGGRQQVSRDGGRAPVWRRDGRELFYATEGTPRRMMVVDIRPGAVFDAGLPQVLFEISDDLHTGTAMVPAYDADLDGRRFLFVRRYTEPLPPPPSQMHVVLNWFEELKAKVPAK
jgi:eukaryotic-like serine/threonine-protein kinase